MTVRIINADVLEGLRQLPDESVHCVVTSPPYWGLRSYLPADHPAKGSEIGNEPTLEEHIEKLVAVFREVRRVLRADGVCWINYGDAYAGSWGAQSRGEPPGDRSKLSGGQIHAAPKGTHTGSLKRTPGAKQKDLLLIPFRLALALQADGWWIRSRLPWIKPNGMPSSVEDRPGTSVEEIFMLTKSARYFYDGEAIKQIAKYPAGPNAPDKVKSPQGQGFARRNKNESTEGHMPEASARTRAGFNDRWKAKVGADRKDLPGPTYQRHQTSIEGGQSLQGAPDGTRAFRQGDVFFSAVGDVRGVVANGDGEILALHVATQPYTEAHFATFPPKLIEPLILAGTSAKGCCSECGAPWERIVEKTFVPQPDVSAEKGKRGAGNQKPMDETDGRDGFPRGTTSARTTGWKPTCECFIDDKGAIPPDVVPCTVLDPFMGAGTTAMVADRLNRNAIGFELSDEHTERAQRRVTSDRGDGADGWLFDVGGPA